MPRAARSWTSQLSGSIHIISRVAGGEFLFHDEEKEVFMKLIEHFASGFFIDIHAFAVMGNHFHILIRVPEKEKFLRRFRGKDGDEKLLDHLSYYPVSTQCVNLIVAHAG